MRSLIDMQYTLKKSMSIGALLGNLEGVPLPGLLTEKKKYIWIHFLKQRPLKF